MGFKNCSTNEYMNEFIVTLKLISFKNGNFENFSNSMVIKKILTLVVIFFLTHLRYNQKKFETEPIRWLQSKDP